MQPMGRHPIAADFGAPGNRPPLPEPAASVDERLAELAALADPMLPLTPIDTDDASQRMSISPFATCSKRLAAVTTTYSSSWPAPWWLTWGAFTIRSSEPW